MSIILDASLGSVGTLRTRVMEPTMQPPGDVQLPGIFASFAANPYSTPNGNWLLLLGRFNRFGW